MDLDYTSIFSVLTDLIKCAIPIAVFLYLVDVMFFVFFSLAFPKRFKRGE
ncbi:MAG: hypothetical protein J6M60_03570 [Clostridia bacterium]|nr:hypothetical protein [Clostridia bacterium]